jgi:hypothetical protein
MTHICPTATALLCLLFTSSCGAKAGIADCKRYTSRTYHYSVCVPKGWFILEPAMIANFPPAERETGTINPEGGAYVEIWGGRTGGPVPGFFDSEGPQADGSVNLPICCIGRAPIRVKEEKSQNEFGVTVSDYFDLGSGQKLVAALYFWPHDPKAPEYLKVLHWMIGTLRLSPHPSR